MPKLSTMLGGAERLIVDAAVELSSNSHNVHIFTSHHDKMRCFEETVSGLYSFSFILLNAFMHAFCMDFLFLIIIEHGQVSFQLLCTALFFPDIFFIVSMQFVHI